MSDAIKGGMYAGVTGGIQPVSLDRRITKIKTETGQIVEVPSLDYMRDLEGQILELTKKVGILEQQNKTSTNHTRRLDSAIRKVDSKLR